MEIWSKNVLRDKTKQKTYKFEKKKKKSVIRHRSQQISFILGRLQISMI